ncbi:Asp-tRNA(Asn)/Glu-tRNA(Gln) amidotransferase subunit GatC [Candidatus Woesearchaeota archaeon]|nr:Asp-tRNA(Asn)/Glu-tRNA(Gln) amidotransferase subunit GatC [Candidatus Woesearchaeota archaeon]
MKINKEILQGVANNARIKLSKKEVDELLPQLNGILKIFSQLNGINTNNIEPSFQPVEVKNVFREDRVESCKEDVLVNVKNKEDRYFKGPKSI